jgi:hypothetical protein
MLELIIVGITSALISSAAYLYGYVQGRRDMRLEGRWVR